MAALDPGPQPREEAAEEDALGGEDVAGQEVLEEADGGPGGRHGAGGKGGHAEGGGEDAVQGGERRVVEGLEAR